MFSFLILACTVLSDSLGALTQSCGWRAGWPVWSDQLRHSGWGSAARSHWANRQAPHMQFPPWQVWGQLLATSSFLPSQGSFIWHCWHLGWTLLCFRDCPARCRMFSTIPGLYEINAKDNSLPFVVTTKNVSRHDQRPLELEAGGKIIPGW